MRPSLSLFLVFSLGMSSALLLAGPSPVVARPTGADAERTFAAALVALSRGDREVALDLLESLCREDLDVRLRARLDFLAGILYAKQQRWQEAEAPLERASRTNPELQDYSLFWLGRSLLEQGKPEGAVRALTRLLSLSQPSRWKGPAQLYLAEAHERKGDLSAAQAAYRGFVQNFPSSASTPRARLGLARIALRRGDKEEAGSLLLEVECRHPESGEARQARALREELFPSLLPPKSHRWQRAQGLLSHGDYRKAAEEFKQLAEDSSLSPVERAQASLQAGMALFQCRRYAEAAQCLSCIAGSGLGAEVEEALFWLGRTHLRLGNRPEGRFHLLSLLCRFPQGSRTDDALYILGQDEEAEGDLIQARDSYSRLIQSFPGSEFRERAIWRRGFSSYKLGDFMSAEEDFDLLVLCHPESGEANQWLYWLGRCREKRGMVAEAARAYRSILRSNRFDYYYFRALIRDAGIEAFPSGAGIGKPGLPDLPKGGASSFHANSSSPSGASADCYRCLVRARQLATLGLKEEALAEYGEVVRRWGQDGDAVREASRVSLRLGRPDLALNWSRRALPPDWAGTSDPMVLDLARYSFPLAYGEILAQTGKIAGVDPYLILAVVREESAFSSSCISSAGARGLMQLLPSTAERLARRRGDLWPNGKIDLFQPDLNLRLGGAYLRDLREEFAQDPIFLLASYNAGPEAVKRWRRRWPSLDQDEFVETIPYAETREYVKRVLRSYEIYRLLHQGTEEARSFDDAIRYPS